MTTLTFLVLCGMAVLLWKVATFIPDLSYHLREIQSELTRIRTLLDERQTPDDE